MAINTDKYTESKNKSSIRFVPLFFVFTYPILVALDVYTTYLASPDLKYEQNPIVNFLSLGWTGIILLSFGLVMSIIFFVILANKFLISSIILRKKTNLNFRLCAIIAVYIIFFGHYIGSIYAFFNNTMAHIYLNGNDGVLLYSLSHRHIEFTKLLVPWRGYVLFNSLICVLATVIFLCRVQFLRLKYASRISSQNLTYRK